MKALELADKLSALDNFYFEESSRYDQNACQVVGDAELELRRLAEVNAELLGALEDVRDKTHGPDVWERVNKAIDQAHEFDTHPRDSATDAAQKVYDAARVCASDAR